MPYVMIMGTTTQTANGRQDNKHSQSTVQSFCILALCDVSCTFAWTKSGYAFAISFYNRIQRHTG